MRLIRSGRNRRTGAGPPSRWTSAKNSSSPGSWTSWATPTYPTWPPGRVERMACIIDSWVPTASITEWAPYPPVISLTRETPSSPRSVTMSVAPNSSASFCRASWRLIAMIRSAPSSRAASTASRPTAPSPTIATVLPGRTSAATAPNQPVPSTSEAASRLGIRAGLAVGGHEGAVGQGDAQVLGLRAVRADGLHAGAAALVAGLADLAGAVRGHERADDEVAGPYAAHLAARLLDDPGVLVAHRGRAAYRLDAAV